MTEPSALPKADVGSNLIFSTRDEFQFGALAGRRAIGARQRHREPHMLFLRRKNGARAFRCAMQALLFDPHRSQNYALG
jgi:hypothetical protein